MMIRSVLAAFVASSLAVIGGAAEPAETGRRAVAIIFPTDESNVEGIVEFREVKNDGNIFDLDGTTKIDSPVVTAVHVSLRGFPPNVSASHGFHVHEFGDVTDLKYGLATGGHFNPTGKSHACSTVNGHAGDMGSIEAGADGKAEKTLYSAQLSFDDDNSGYFIGRAVVIHEKQDNCTGPVGFAGKRLAQGVVFFNYDISAVPKKTVNPATPEVAIELLKDVDFLTQFTLPQGSRGFDTRGSLLVHQKEAFGPAYVAASISGLDANSTFGIIVALGTLFQNIQNSTFVGNTCTEKGKASAIISLTSDANGDIVIAADTPLKLSGNFSLALGDLQNSIVGNVAGLYKKTAECISVLEHRVAFGFVGIRNDTADPKFVIPGETSYTVSSSSAAPSPSSNNYGSYDNGKNSNNYGYNDNGKKSGDHGVYNDNNGKDATGGNGAYGYDSQGTPAKDPTGRGNNYGSNGKSDTKVFGTYANGDKQATNKYGVNKNATGGYLGNESGSAQVKAGFGMFAIAALALLL